MKSLSEPASPTAYGNVFLTKSELLKSNVWSKTCSTNFDLYEFPIKCGNTEVCVFVLIPTKYA